MRPMSLRGAFLVFATALGFMGVLSGGALIFFTTALHRTTSGAEAAVESVRIAEELEVELLSHWSTSDSLARISSEARIRDHLLDASRFVGSAYEGELVVRLGTELDAYIAAVEEVSAAGGALLAQQDASRQEFDAQFGSARELIQTNVEQSRDLKRAAASWDRTGNVLGAVVIVLLVGGLGVLGLFARRAVFGPARHIAKAVDLYAKGDRTSRAVEDGAEEFRIIARRFNEMASTIERQREHQMAFLAGVAHDIRNPLSALKMAGALLPPGGPLPSEERLRQFDARVQRQVSRLERMVFDFLDAARIEAGRLELQVEPYDIRDIAKATIDLFEPTAPGHQLSLTAPRDPVIVACDPVRIEQVLNNLVSNAIKYSPRGGRVSIAIEREDGSISLSVSDEGIGISAEDLEQVFSPFRRTGASKELVPGVGLGLFVARRIIESHGGRLTVESEPDQGCTFRVELPEGRKGAGTAVALPATPERASLGLE